MFRKPTKYVKSRNFKDMKFTQKILTLNFINKNQKHNIIWSSSHFQCKQQQIYTPNFGRIIVKHNFYTNILIK